MTSGASGIFHGVNPGKAIVPTEPEIEAVWKSYFQQNMVGLDANNVLHQAVMINRGAEYFWGNYSIDSLVKKVLDALGGDVSSTIKSLVAGGGGVEGIKLKIAKLVKSVVVSIVGKFVPSFLAEGVASMVVPPVVNALFNMFN